MDQLDQYIKAITSVVDRTDNLYEKWAKKRGENSYVSRILYMLYASGITKQKEIVDDYGLPKQTVNSVITELQKKGYVLLTPDEKDRRSKVITLTEPGKQYAKSIVEPLLSCEKSVLAEMGRDRVEMLIDTMKQYADLLEQAMSKF